MASAPEPLQKTDLHTESAPANDNEPLPGGSVGRQSDRAAVVASNGEEATSKSGDFSVSETSATDTKPAANEHPKGPTPPISSQSQRPPPIDMANLPNHVGAPYTNPVAELLEVDCEDADSAIGDVGASTLSQSVRSSVYEFIEENGRTYHSYGERQYFLPNDESEQERLDLQHQLFLLTFDNQLHLSPTGPLHNVLDIGTGTGIWAIDFALRNPAAVVLGTDLSPIQPEYVPPNCSFEIDDAEDPWVFPQRFDLIHGRALASCFKNPETVIRSAAAALAPGGWLEYQDIVIPMRCIDDSWNGSALQRWNNVMVECVARAGRDMSYSQRYHSLFKAAGLEDVVERHFVWPSNHWVKGKQNKRLALWFQKDLGDGLEAISLRLLIGVGGISKGEVTALLDQVRKDLANPKYHAYMPVVVTMGRKPT